MLSTELNNLISYVLSVVIKENRNRYNKLFIITNNKINRGDLTPFIISFLEFIKTSLIHMDIKLREKQEKLDYYESILQNKYQGKPKYWALLYYLLQNALFGFEGLTMSDLQNLSSLGYTAIKKILELNGNLIKTNQVGKRIFYTVDLEELDMQ